MKSGTIFTLLVGVLFIAIAAATALNFKLYKDCNERIEISKRQLGLLSDKINEFDLSISSFKLNLEDVKADYERYKNEVSAKLNQPDQIKAEINGKVENLKQEMQGIEDKYSAIQSDIQEKLKSIKAEFETAIKDAAKKVDLGEISVKNEASGEAADKK